MRRRELIVYLSGSWEGRCHVKTESVVCVYMYVHV